MPQKLTQSLKSAAAELGFQLAGACPAVSPQGFHHLEQWIDEGFAGEMSYFHQRRSAYQHPRHVLDGAVSILMLGMNYQTAAPVAPTIGQGRVSRYAWGAGDYHNLIHGRLKQLGRFAESLDKEIVCRGVVDTAPLMEREFGQLAGLGWPAKNTLLINRNAGSWFFLAALLLNVALDYDQPFLADHCGSCTACIDACPTQAFAKPYVLDATRCISYLTIEHRTAVPYELRAMMGDWVFGCDVCQNVCPWNNKSPATNEIHFQPLENQNPIDLHELFELNDEGFRIRFRRTPLWRPKRRGLLRNAAIALGNAPSESNIRALAKGLDDAEPLIRGASAWALGQHDFGSARILLEKRIVIETDDQVRQEIVDALMNQSFGRH